MTRGNQTGLSLLEVLVVFVLISMISAVLIQGFGYGLALYDRVENRGQRIVVDVLSAKWFRMVNRALVPSTSPGQSLIGDVDGFNSVTMNPLLGSAGTPSKISWQIRNDVLHYVEDGRELEILPLPADAGIQYLTPAGVWIDSWPQDRVDYLLPAAVRIRSDSGFQMTSSVRSRLRPNLVLEESRRER